MTTQTTIRLREHTRPAQLRITGEIDTRTLEHFHDVLTYAVTRHNRLVVDLSDTRFLSVAALRTLAQHTDRIKALLVTRDSPITRAVRLTGLDQLLVYQGNPHHHRTRRGNPLGGEMLTAARKARRGEPTR